MHIHCKIMKLNWHKYTKQRLNIFSYLGLGPSDHFVLLSEMSYGFQNHLFSFKYTSFFFFFLTNFTYYLTSFVFCVFKMWIRTFQYTKIIFALDKVENDNVGIMAPQPLWQCLSSGSSALDKLDSTACLNEDYFLSTWLNLVTQETRRPNSPPFSFPTQDYIGPGLRNNPGVSGKAMLSSN